jgi:hypothetical protein
MRPLQLISILSLISFTNLAQKPVDANKGPTNMLGNGVVDGVVIKEEIPQREAIPYEHVRSSDYVWSKRVFSRIDKKERINHALFYPLDFIPDEISTGNAWEEPKLIQDIENQSWIRNNERYSLWTIIMKHIFLGDLRIYDVSDTTFLVDEDGYKFKYPLNPSDPLASCKGKFFVDGGDSKYRKNVIKRLSGGTIGNDWPFALTDGTPWPLKKEDANESASQMLNRLMTAGLPGFQRQGSDFQNATLLIADPELFAKFEVQYNETKVLETVKEPLKIKYITSASITAYNIKEDWFFDKERSMLDRRIIAIAPVGRYVAKEYEDSKKRNERFDRFKNFVFENDRDIDKVQSGTLVTSKMDEFTKPFVELELFWLYFPDLRNVIVNYYTYNDKSDSQWMSFDDLFWKRKFSSTIYRVSDKFDREIEDYKYGVDALYEAERIKDDIRKWEIDVWNY